MIPVTRLSVRLAGHKVGQLGLGERGRIYFQYDPDWIARGFDLAPSALDFNPSVQLPKRIEVFDGLHGVFHDSLPDGWGLLLMDRFFRQTLGERMQEITPLDRLAYLGDRGMGALEYEPALPTGNISETVDITTLARAAQAMLAGKTPDVLQQLYIQGGSPGGARPKVTVALSDDTTTCQSGFSPLSEGYDHWLVKFRSRDDPLDMGRIEQAYAAMAHLANIEMPESRLIPVRIGRSTEALFATRRFDRDGNDKHHILTLSGYLYASHRYPSVGYDSVLGATLHLTRDVREVARAFRLMVFNVLAHNKDDHTRNFSFIHQENGWRLAPAYDLTFSTGMRNEHATDIAGSGNPNLRQIKQIAHQTGIKNWREIIEQTRAATVQWRSLAQEWGVARTRISTIGKALAEIDHRFTA
ncbi:MAG: type II toxin-antitoxin system HipA family toxin [Phycisphaerales bacterium]|nr:type II toxin-antitoxin system HipA family toxin [Phycisphaerales bacterium]